MGDHSARRAQGHAFDPKSFPMSRSGIERCVLPSYEYRPDEQVFDCWNKAVEALERNMQPDYVLELFDLRTVEELDMLQLVCVLLSGFWHGFSSTKLKLGQRFAGKSEANVHNAQEKTRQRG